MSQHEASVHAFATIRCGAAMMADEQNDHVVAMSMEPSPAAWPPHCICVRTHTQEAPHRRQVLDQSDV